MLHQTPYAEVVHDEAPGPAQLRPEDLTGWTLVQAHHRVARRFHETFAAAGLTAHQFGALVQLAVEPGVSQAALARKVLVTPQSMGDLIVQLEASGYLARTPARTRGGANRVVLTDSGRQVLRGVYPQVGAINTPAALGLSAAEAATLNHLLHQVLTHLDRT